MQISYKDLPVYQQKQRILDTLSNNQVIIVQSPTGSGKTTQIPVILHESGFSNNGIIAVTQPRRIGAQKAALAVLKENPNVLIVIEGIEIYPKDLSSNSNYQSIPQT